MRPILTLLTIALTAFAYDLDPLFLVDNHIDVRTGDWIQKEGHAIYRSTKGQWQLYPHSHLVLRGPDYTVCEGQEITGFSVTYRLTKDAEFQIEIPPCSTNTSMGEIGAKTYLGNQKLKRPDKFTLIVETPQKTKRIYKKAYHKGNDLYFTLQEESYEDGSSSIFGYDREGTLYTINGKPVTNLLSDSYPTGRIYQYEDKQFTYYEDHTAVESSDGSKTLFFFDSLGRLTSIEKRNQLGDLLTQTPYEFSENGCLIKAGDHSYSYDERGNVIEEWIGTHHLARIFDAKDRVIKLIDEKEQGRLTTSYTYDRNDLLTRVDLDDENSVRTITIEGGPTQPSAIFEASEYKLLKVTRYTYCGEKVEETVFDPSGTLCLRRWIEPSEIHRPWLKHYPVGICQDENIEIERDHFGRMIARRIFDTTHKLVREETWTYNACHLLSHTNPHGLTTTYTHNTLGQKIEETLHTSQGPITTQISYDPFGKVISSTCGEIATHFTYNLEGDCIETREETLDGQLLTLNAPQKTPSNLPSINLPPNLDGVTVEYDLFGNITCIRANDETVHYEITYDTRNLPVHVIDHVQNCESRRIYDDLGNLISETLLNGLTIRSERDLYGRKIAQTLPDDSKIYYRWGVKFLSEIQRISHRRKFDYLHQFMEYNLTGFPIRQRQIGGFGHLTFDMNNNQIKGIHSLYLDQKNELVEDHVIPQLKEPYSFKTDALGRITEIIQPGKVILFTYDPWNRRMTKKVQEEHWDSRYDPIDLAFIYDNSREIGTYSFYSNRLIDLRVLAEQTINSGDQSIAYELGGLLYLPQFGLTGNPASLISYTRSELMESYRFSPSGACVITDIYGNTLKKSKAMNPWNFRGYRQDIETGLLYIEGAYYDPALGTFLSNPRQQLPSRSLTQTPLK